MATFANTADTTKGGSSDLKRTALRALALAGVVALSLLVSACGGAPGNQVAHATTTTRSSSSTNSAASSRLSGALAFSRCMRSHGVPNFPDPGPQGNLSPSQAGVAKQGSAAAYDACKHLLPGGSATPQQRQHKVAFALKAAQCLRRHGFPTFPDPTGSGQDVHAAGINPNSPQFQAAESACEKQVRKAFGPP